MECWGLGFRVWGLGLDFAVGYCIGFGVSGMLQELLRHPTLLTTPPPNPKYNVNEAKLALDPTVPMEDARSKEDSLATATPWKEDPHLVRLCVRLRVTKYLTLSPSPSLECGVSKVVPLLRLLVGV